jgi:hypothetical protein
LIQSFMEYTFKDVMAPAQIGAVSGIQQIECKFESPGVQVALNTVDVLWCQFLCAKLC